MLNAQLTYLWLFFYYSPVYHIMIYASAFVCFLLALACENDLAKITCEQKYSRIIKISDVKVTEKSEDYCENDKTVNKTRLCVASQRDKQKLFSELEEICNNKPSCSIHLAHGPYDVIHLPCRHLNLSIRLEIIYDCICKFVRIICIY